MAQHDEHQDSVSRYHAGHSHAHGGGHHQHGDPNNHGRAFLIAIALNSFFVVVEFVYGFTANSTALMADAGHNLSDVLGLILAWGAAILARKAPNERYTYGLRRTSILAALANAIFLVVACGAIAWEAISTLLAAAHRGRADGYAGGNVRHCYQRLVRLAHRVGDSDAAVRVVVATAGAGGTGGEPRAGH